MAWNERLSPVKHDYIIQDKILLWFQILSTALAKNHAKPAKGDTSHVTKMNIFCFSQLIMS